MDLVDHGCDELHHFLQGCSYGLHWLVPVVNSHLYHQVWDSDLLLIQHVLQYFRNMGKERSRKAFSLPPNREWAHLSQIAAAYDQDLGSWLRDHRPSGLWPPIFMNRGSQGPRISRHPG